MDFQLLTAVLFGIVLLLLLILKFRIQAFIALLIAGISVGLVAGMSPIAILDSIKNGMGSTLGFVAVVVGLGAMFGAILEYSGGAEALSNYLLKKFGEKHTTGALTLTGFIVAIPVFFDVGFIILVPIIYSLQRRTRKSLLLYGFPLLAGLAVTHAFIPPTPGPVAVAEILSAELGWVILFGLLVGIPTTIVSGPLFARYIAKRIHVDAPKLTTVPEEAGIPVSVKSIVTIIAAPIVLIVLNTILNSTIFYGYALRFELVADRFIIDLKQIFTLIGHPFVALIIANMLAWYFLGIRKGVGRDKLLDIMTRSMGPAGIIILLTGAGGAFKQMLVDTGAGTMIANYLNSSGIGVLFFAFIVAALVRILQGSATVAMITAAGIVAPVLGDMTELNKALLVISIASGASILSHVNDSGFWLVSKYLGLDEKQTLRSWTLMTTVLAITGLVSVQIISLFI